MTEEKQHKIALMRYAIIAPLVCHTNKDNASLKNFFEEAAQKTYTDSSGNSCAYSPKTIERWYYCYCKEGFDGLLRQSRSDNGKPRKIDEDVYAQIKYYKEKHPRMPATEILNKLVSNGLIKQGDISLSTINRCVNRIADELNTPAHEEMRRYERAHINEVWCGDSCVGPKITIDGAKRRIFIIALIDDASRYITGASVSYRDDFVSLLSVMRTAVAKYGVPNMLNFDNGHTYKNRQMELLCARIGTTAHYCQPYKPEQKSKIERWFRTLRDKWLATTDLTDFKTLDEVQKSLDAFVSNYNHTVHSSLNGKTPDERFFSESKCIRRLTDDAIEKSFLLEIERRVTADNVIMINNTEYEVDWKYSCKKVRLRYSPDMNTIYLVEGNGELTPIRLLNKQENSTVKRNKTYLSGGDN